MRAYPIAAENDSASQQVGSKTIFDLESCLAPIPDLPDVISNVLSLSEDNELNSTTLASAIETDYLLSHRVIRIANSAYYSPLDRIESVLDSVRILGYESVRSLAITTTVVKGLWVADSLFNRDSFWLHGLRCGIIARNLAHTIQLVNPELLFMIGVMHDVGRYALIQSDPERFQAALKLMNQEGIALWRAEKQVLGLHHGEIGGILAQKWKLPDPMIVTIRFHHEPEDAADYTRNSRIIALADALAHSVSPQSRSRYISTPLLPELWQPLGLTDDSIRELCSNRDQIERDARTLFEGATSQ